MTSTVTDPTTDPTDGRAAAEAPPAGRRYRSTTRRLLTTELRLLARDPLTLTFVLVFPIVTMLIIGGSFGTEPDEVFPVNPSHWYVASYFTVVIGATGFIMLPVHIASYRERGVLLGTLLPSARAAQAIGLLLFVPSFLLGVGGPPPAVMSDALRETADLRPLGLFTAAAANEPGFLVVADVFEVDIRDQSPVIGAEIEELRWVARAEADELEIAPLARENFLP